ncbi:MAG: SCO1664 family protein [Actinomycetota bacterium]|nr:SCO1664 family protein [Actinomycetota bacterium]
MSAPSSRASKTTPSPDVNRLLTEGTLEVVGRLTDASNVTLLGRLQLNGESLHCIYKPIRGERPLWDFPDGTLAYREVAAYLVSEAAGWHCVPTTVLRSGPLGDGMVQEWIGPTPDLSDADDPDDFDEPDEFDDTGAGEGSAGESDAGAAATIAAADLVALLPASQVPAGWLPVFRALDTDGTVLAVCHADDPRLELIAGFDLVVNNADRKAPHLLTAADQRILGVDHGIAFHVEDKLRTILWGWAGGPLPDAVVDGFDRLQHWLDAADNPLDELLTIAELRRLRQRIGRYLRYPVFPQPPKDRTPIPWPPL